MENAIPQKMKVLFGVPYQTANKNPYISQLAESLRREGLSVDYWALREALVRRYDIVHLHWPELLYKGRNRRETAIKSAVTIILLAIWRMRRTSIVWTVHNKEPHNGLSAITRRVDSFLRRKVTAVISINDTDWIPPGMEGRIQGSIPHGHYVDWFAGYRHSNPSAFSASFIGQIRPYKGVETLVKEFRAIEANDVSLRIAGAPVPVSMREGLWEAAGADSRIRMDLRFLSDEDLVDVTTGSSLVILPYTQMFNSGALLLALSLNRPVLAPETPVNVLLQKEFGTHWINLYDGPLTADLIEKALRQVSTVTHGSPDFSRRHWDLIAAKHVEIYENATSTVKNS